MAATGMRKRQLVTMPPRHGKSEETSHWFPAWYFERFPENRVILTSYEAQYARDWGCRVRDTLRANERELTVRVSKSTVAGQNWRTTRGGGMMTAGVGGPITGKGANCFPAGTLVQTDAGAMPIERIARAVNPPSVCAFNHLTGACEWRRVVAARERRAVDFVEVSTAAGRTLRCTPEHGICVGAGYAPARTLNCGDGLLAVEPAGGDPAPVDRLLLMREVAGDSTLPRARPDAVRDIRPLRGADQSVYDIEVDGCHNFFAEGVLVHNCFIGDDLIKNWQEAASPTIRAKVWNWLRSTAYTRLEPDAAVVLVATRWHVDDPIGKLLQLMLEDDTAEKWDLIELPAIAGDNDLLGRRPGEALWAERYPIEELERIRGVLTDEIWMPLYQCRPRMGAGFGLAYPDWSADNRRPVSFNPHLPLCLCCDFNVDPMCWVIAQFDSTGVRVLDEIVISDTNTPRALEELHRRLPQYSEQVRRLADRPMELKLYGDAAGSARSTAGKSDWALIKESFRASPDVRWEIDVPAANPFVKDRVAAVNALIRNARGERRLVVDPRCRALARDFERVTWKPGTIELDKKADKALTHASDALGYLAHREFRIDGFHRVITQ